MGDKLHYAALADAERKASQQSRSIGQRSGANWERPIASLRTIEVAPSAQACDQ
jgi:hypothetical protein